MLSQSQYAFSNQTNDTQIENKKYYKWNYSHIPIGQICENDYPLPLYFWFINYKSDSYPLISSLTSHKYPTIVLTFSHVLNMTWNNWGIGLRIYFKKHSLFTEKMDDLTRQLFDDVQKEERQRMYEV